MSHGFGAIVGNRKRLQACIERFLEGVPEKHQPWFRAKLKTFYVSPCLLPSNVKPCFLKQLYRLRRPGRNKLIQTAIKKYLLGRDSVAESQSI